MYHSFLYKFLRFQDLFQLDESLIEDASLY